MTRDDIILETSETIEKVLRDEIKTQMEINCLLRHELEIYKSRSDHWRDICVWIYKRSREALMLEPGYRGFKDARDNALCEINHKTGGALR